MTAGNLMGARYETPVLETRNLSATYVERGERLPVLEELSLAVAPGEFLAVLGPSGSGKSTLLDIIAGLITQDSGEVLLDGGPTTAAGRLGRSAYMHQRDLLLPWRTALDNATLALEVRGMPRDRARDAARERFPAFGLEGFEERYPAQLSGGMRQRVAFLRTLLTGQPLVLLDEPFGALDALTRAAMQDWLADLLRANPRSVVLVTHDIDEAIFLADRVLVLSQRPATVIHTEYINAPRPRHRADVTSPAFNGHRQNLLEALGLVPVDPS